MIVIPCKVSSFVALETIVRLRFATYARSITDVTGSISGVGVIANWTVPHAG